MREAMEIQQLQDTNLYHGWKPPPQSISTRYTDIIDYE